ncbi:MAG: VWA domain-containing protein [Verrucomicrobia bacterium]|nr:VWA domain-containing protein [Verrucomicrobiota bacterium]
MRTAWSGRHIAAAAAATLISLALHVVVIAKFPNLPVGKPPEMGLTDRIQTTRLGDVKRGPMSVLDRPSRYRPESPERIYDVEEEYLSYVDALEEALPAEPDLKENVSLEAEDRPLEAPELPATREDWQPRAEILQIEDSIHDDNVSALPRRYVDVVPRGKDAPDITFPVDWDQEEAARQSQSGLGTEAGPLPGLSRAGSLALAAGTAQNVAMTDEGAKALEESSALMDEDLEDIVSAKPIEELLALDVSTFSAPGDDSVYFRVGIRRKSEMSLPVLPKDVLLVQDCSESMTQKKLNLCKTGLHRWLDLLADNDRYNFIRFSDHTEMCFEDWTSPAPANDARAAWFIENMKAKGKTDVLETLRKLLAIRKDDNRPLIAILVSDGRPTMGMVDSSDIIEQFTASNEGRISVFTVGGGHRVNHFLMDLLSYRNRGDSLIVEDRREMPAALEQWARELSRPVLADLKFNFSGGLEGEVYPDVLTHLYMDRPLVLYGKCVPSNEPFAVRIVGNSGGKAMDMVFTMDLNQADRGTDDIRTMWAWHKVYHLIGEHIQTKRPGVMNQIRDLAGRFGLAVPYGGDIPLP